MGDPQASPISQLLNSLGLTREDLNKRSDQMRQFLIADSTNSSRVFDLQNTYSHTNSEPSSSTLFPASRTVTQPSPSPLPDASARPPEPETQLASEPSEESASQRQTVSMDSVIERQRLARKERRGKKDKDRAVTIRRSTSQQALSVSREGSPQACYSIVPCIALMIVATGSTSAVRSDASAEQVLPRTHCRADTSKYLSLSSP